MKLKTRKSIASRAFTLIELLVVILIIAILASLIVPQVMGNQDKAKVAAAKSDLRVLGDALDAYRLEVGNYPSTEDGLSALSNAPSDAQGWHGPYLKKQIGNDPWGHPYEYSNTGDTTYNLLSYGSDGAQGGSGYAEDIDESTAASQ